ncbi:hypothetical protein CFK41_10355 [Brachybacterium ginsengisoli]|uniref:Uncharacterized protein n=1 Tax=Brachybacterium ginsengisoli TaxID=1331682 RepID=A0A291GYE3_9MICO|nr:hypothetical protein [Brachybacterium ginsengisoli]ATG55114.1 hypothetical protein CFK41_10355 [Brachybacterium ginsengisoli]
MESINLGAVLFGILLLLWLGYALPRTARRREVMGRARAADEAEMSSQARDLSAAVHARRTSSEVNPPMSQDRLLLRPADPTRRPRFDADPGNRMDPVEERSRSRRALGLVLGGLLAVTAALVLLAVLQIVSWWIPLLGIAGLGVYLLGLRRAELQRRARLTRAATRAREQRARAETARRREAVEQPAVAAAPQGTQAPADQGPAAPTAPRADLEVAEQRAAEQVARPGEWTPRPVPRPSYALRGEVDDLATRHAAHRQSMLATSVPLENERVEELEAVDEAFAPAQDLHLDDILARRRA